MRLVRVLVAEDEVPVREFVVRALQHAGHEVVAAADGLEAVERLSEATFDVLVTDIRMPGMDGIALALKTAKDYPAMPVVLMSGYATERQRAHNLDAIVHSVIAKPFDLKQICDAVAAASRTASATKRTA